MLIYPTGSYFICNPPVVDTDIDFIIFTDNFDSFCTGLKQMGFIQGSKEEYPIKNFLSFKLKQITGTVINYIVTNKIEFYHRMLFATDMAKHQNLTNKEDRIKLFNEIVNDKMA